MKLFPILACFLLFLAACGGPEISDQEHLALVERYEELEEVQDDMEDMLEDAIDAQEDWEGRITDTTAQDKVNMIKQLGAELTGIESTLQKHARLLKRHQQYFDDHEKTALAANEIQAQHSQIRQDQEQMSTEHRQMEQELQRIQRQLDAMAGPES